MKCPLRCFDRDACAEPCVDQIEAQRQDEEPPYDWGE